MIFEKKNGMAIIVQDLIIKFKIVNQTFVVVVICLGAFAADCQFDFFPLVGYSPSSLHDVISFLFSGALLGQDDLLYTLNKNTSIILCCGMLQKSVLATTRAISLYWEWFQIVIDLNVSKFFAYKDHSELSDLLNQRFPIPKNSNWSGALFLGTQYNESALIGQSCR